MTKYLLGYHGTFMTEAAPADDPSMKAWMTWMSSMGNALIDGGNPARDAMTVSAGKVSKGGGSNPITGYTIVEAKDFDHAVKLSQGCPILKAGGSIEVSELGAM